MENSKDIARDWTDCSVVRALVQAWQPEFESLEPV